MKNNITWHRGQSCVYEPTSKGYLLYDAIVKDVGKVAVITDASWTSRGSITIKFFEKSYLAYDNYHDWHHVVTVDVNNIKPCIMANKQMVFNFER